MSFANSIMAAFIIVTIVFIVLAVLFIVLKLQTSILVKFIGNENKVSSSTQMNKEVMPKEKTSEISYGELELIGVDEQTAARVMAMASYKLNIPLNELHFKAIKALD